MDPQNNSQGYIDLEDEDTDQPGSGFTETQKAFHINSINKLLRLSYGEFGRQPGIYDGISSYLRTMRTKLHQNLYPSIEALKADFDRLKESSMIRYGIWHKYTKDVQNLKDVFEGYMTDNAGPDGDSGPRKKAKTTGSKIPPARRLARRGASSPPRAAKSAMQGRKYPRDHW